MNSKSVDHWPKVGDQLERNQLLCTTLEELEIYECIVKSFDSSSIGRLRSEDAEEMARGAVEQIRIRADLIRMLALKNTPFVV